MMSDTVSICFSSRTTAADSREALPAAFCSAPLSSALSAAMSAGSAASRTMAALFFPGAFSCSLSPQIPLIPSTMANAAAAVLSMTLYFLSFTLSSFLSSQVQDQA